MPHSLWPFSQAAHCEKIETVAHKGHHLGTISFDGVLRNNAQVKPRRMHHQITPALTYKSPAQRLRGCFEKPSRPRLLSEHAERKHTKTSHNAERGLEVRSASKLRKNSASRQPTLRGPSLRYTGEANCPCSEPSCANRADSCQGRVVSTPAQEATPCSAKRKHSLPNAPREPQACASAWLAEIAWWEPWSLGQVSSLWPNSCMGGGFYNLNTFA